MITIGSVEGDVEAAHPKCDPRGACALGGSQSDVRSRPSDAQRKLASLSGTPEARPPAAVEVQASWLAKMVAEAEEDEHEDDAVCYI